MTSYTRKLYAKNRFAAVQIRRQNLALIYGKTPTLACFTLNDYEDASAAVRGGKVEAKIEGEFDVNERLQRYADRGWK